MCGRFTQIRLEDFLNAHPWIVPPAVIPGPRYNLAPSQSAAVVLNLPQPRMDLLSWGLVPSWAQDPAIGNRMINARAETLASKPAFRSALASRRCAVPCDGFYEWRKEPDGRKTPIYLQLAGAQPMALAGLWEVWRPPEGEEKRTFTIITTAPNELLSSIHDRMPAILDEQALSQWLLPGAQPTGPLLGLLRPFDSQSMTAQPVSKAVNNPRFDAPDCVAPLEGP